MKRNVTNRVYLLLALLPLLWGCGDSLTGLMHRRAADSVPVSVVVSRESGGRSRTVAPDHVPAGDLENTGLYRLVLTGTSDMGSSVTVDPFRIANGMGGFDLPPGAWSLTLAAHTVAGNTKVLEGTAFVIIVDYHVTVHIDLEPLRTADGTVSVQFTLPQSVVVGLDPAGNSSKTVTVALYDDGGQAVANTSRSFTVSAANATSSFTYSLAAPAGQYTLRMTAPYTGANSVQKTLGWEDVLHVEGNRESAHSVTLPGSALGRPGNPYRRDKVSASVTVPSTGGNTNAATFSGSNITGSQSFNPYGEGLWIFAANWDGSGGNTPINPNGQGGGNGGTTQGNEVLLVVWDAVYNAEYYELEVLLHPNYGYNNNQGVSNGAKYDRLPVSDSDWQQFLQKNPTPLSLRFTGRSGDANNYKTKVYSYTIAGANNATKNIQFDFVAWRGIADGKNGGYKTSTGSTESSFISAPNAAGLSTRGSATYRIGLEKDCNALAILMHNFAPQHWYGIRVRGVNEHGYSDWVYWKGGR